MLKTMNVAEWHEDPADARLIETLTPDSSPTLMRQLFPLRGRLKQYCRIHQMPSGTVLEYVRTKHTPAYYPLEAIVIREGKLYKSSYSSDEVQMVGEVWRS